MKTFKCRECGLLFDEPKELDYGYISLNGPASGCPACSGAYDYTQSCNGCGADCLPEELFDGLCLRCLEDALTPKTAYAYMTKCGTDVFADFMFYEVWKSDTPKKLSSALMQHLADTYFEFAKRSPDTLTLAIRRYLFDDEVGVQDFAEWYTEEIRKKVDKNGENL